MKALVMSEPGNVKMTELPMPEIKPDEVLVRVRAAGICINDVRDFKGECDYSYPRIGGHEFAGEIYEIGSEVNKNRFHVGQRVVTYVVDNCKECYYCKNGFENVCPDSLNSITLRIRMASLASVTLASLLLLKQKICISRMIMWHLKNWQW